MWFKWFFEKAVCLGLDKLGTSEMYVKLRSTKQYKKSTLDEEQNLQEQMTTHTYNIITRFKFARSV